MALTARVFPKSPHDVLEADDWNAGFGEIAALDKRKLDRAGGAIAGSLSAATIQADTVTVRKAVTLPAGYVTPAGLGMVRTQFQIRMSQGGIGVLWIERYAQDAPPRVPGFLHISMIGSTDGLQPHGIQALGHAFDCVTADPAGAKFIRRGVLLAYYRTDDPTVSKAPVASLDIYTVEDPAAVLEYNPRFIA
jgi:hypothetical protein